MKLIVFYVLILPAFCDDGNKIQTFLQRTTRSVGHKIVCDRNQCAENLQLCDGIKDCKDGCDERKDLCNVVYPDTRCTLPNTKDEDKIYTLNCSNTTPKTGELVPEMSVLSFVCKPGYERDNGDTFFHSFCFNGDWIPDIPTCRKMCSKLNLPADVKYKCYFNNREIECTDNYVAGTKLKISCSLSYHHSNHDEVFCNEYGEWNIKNIKCIPECGRYSDEAKLLYRNNYFPWHVLLSRKWNSSHWDHGSGTLIAPDLVLTGARIVMYTNNVIMPAHEFKVIVNGYLDQGYQKTYDVKEVIPPPKGFFFKQSHYAELDDIAILRLKSKVEISTMVQPVCIDWTGFKLPSEGSSSSSMGKLIRMGEPPLEKNHISILNTEAYSLEICKLKVGSRTPPQYDQFCGKIEESIKTGELDWKTGYFVENPQDHLFYLKGILIRFYRDPDIPVFTNVKTHINWINAIYKTDNDLEKLIPTFSNHHDPTELSYHTANLRFHHGSWGFSCNNGELHIKSTGACYTPTNSDAYITYKVQCPAVATNEHEMRCKDTGYGVLVPEKTVLTPYCKAGYVSISKNLKKSICLDGEWLPKLQPGISSCEQSISNVSFSKCHQLRKLVDCDRVNR